MSQNFLNRLDIYAAGKHHGSSSMAQLMGRELGGVQSRLQKCFLHQPMDGGNADSVAVSGAEECPVVGKLFLIAFFQIVIQCFSASRAKLNETFLIAFADDTDAVLIYIRLIQSHKLTAADAAIEKQHQNGVIPFGILPRNCL